MAAAAGAAAPEEARRAVRPASRCTGGEVRRGAARAGDSAVSESQSSGVARGAPRGEASLGPPPRGLALAGMMLEMMPRLRRETGGCRRCGV